MTFLTESWFWRGTQSAVFYYVSCAPCTKVREQRKVRKDAKRAKAEREMAGTFRHPLPSGTNPGWDEEINLGPGPPPKRLTKEQAKKRKRLRLKPLEDRELESAGAPSSTGTGTTSMDTTTGASAVSQDLSQNRDANWNRRRYQREDEVLWGLEEASSSTGDLSRTASGGGAYYYARNPEVNDLHPPVVSTAPISRKETQWMLQPPPKAKIMEGKERSNRSRSDSGLSGAASSFRSRGSSRRGGAENLGRKVGERLMEEKMARGEVLPAAMSSAAMSRMGSNQSMASAASFPSTTMDQRADKDPGSGSHFLAPPPSHRATTHAPPTTSAALADLPQASPRPPLSTIPSASNNLPRSPMDKRDISQGRPLLLSANSGSSLVTLQMLQSDPSASGSKENGSYFTPSNDASLVMLPPPTPREETTSFFRPGADGRETEGGERPEWHFPLPTMSIQNGQRWSMEI